jgi:hypothetical protein
MPAGRPPIWTDPEALAESVDDYFNEDPQPTWTGLALHLGFVSRESLNNYMLKPEFFDPIKKALTRIENQYEKGLYGKNPAGAIFALKNFKWKDKQEIEQTGGIRVSFSEPGDYIYPSQDKGDSGIPESL